MTEPYRTKGANAFYEGGVKHPQFGGGGGGSKENRLFEKSASITSTLAATSLRNKRFQSSYCAKVRAGAKKKRCSLPNSLYELARKRLLRRLPPQKSSNSYKMRNVSVEMRNKCISLVGRDIPGDYLNLQMFFASFRVISFMRSQLTNTYRQERMS